MANGKDSGFLSSLGLGPVNEEALFQQGLMRGVPQGTNNVAQFAQIGARASGNIRPALHGAFSALGGGSFTQGATQAKDQVIAQEQGIDVETLRARRNIRDEVRAIKADPALDPLSNQMKIAEETVRIANASGDSETAMRALQKLTELRAQQIEFKKAGLAEDKAEQQLAAGRRSLLADAATGAAVLKVGDPEDARPSGAILIEEGPDRGKWLVTRPDGTTETLTGDQIVPFNNATTNLPPGFNKTPVELAIRQAGGGKNFASSRQGLSDSAEKAELVGQIADLMAGFEDPQAVLSLAGKTFIAGDKAIRYVDALANMFGGAETPATYRGAAVSSQGQFDAFTDDAKAALTDAFKVGDIKDIAPQNALAAALGAEQYWAMIMELAFLDARLMEPSNRGLSDKDIANALKRMVADSANPQSLMTRQIQLIDKQLARMPNLGREIVPSGRYSAQQIKDAQYNPDLVRSVTDRLQESRDKLVDQRDRFVPEGVEVTIPEGADQLSEAELQAIIDGAATANP